MVLSSLHMNRSRIRKIVHCIWIMFGLPNNYKPNVSLKKSHLSQAVRLAWCLLCDSFVIQILQVAEPDIFKYRTLYWRTVNKTTWSNPRYNTELLYFSNWVFETPNERGSIYHKQGCEREYLPEYLQCNENWSSDLIKQWDLIIVAYLKGFSK